jgi:glyceraldehyde 3-phosphate dehydrogenase
VSPTRIALVGLGRIGRDLLRILYRSDDIRIAAIDEIAEPAGVEYLIRFDTILGPFPEELSIRDGHLYVVGRQIPMLASRTPDESPWGDLGVDIVIEATGRPRSRASLEQHLERGAKRVILCAPPLEAPDLTVVTGINDDRIGSQHRIISNASCTAHCAAPVIRILNDAFGIERAFVTSVHAYSNQQRLADVPTEDPRRGRAAAENIIPQETNAAQVINELLPELRGRVSGSSISVPVPNGSVVDLVCWHERPVTPTAINEVVRTAAAADWKGILHYEDDPIVSSDVVGSPYSGTFDSQATMVMNDRVSKTLSWFDNSWGYAHRVVDLVRKLAELDAAPGAEAAAGSSEGEAGR